MPSSASPRQRSRAVSIRKVTLYHAEDCHLCKRARGVLEEVRAELPFELEAIDIGGHAELEAKYREWLPVVEVDGERAFVYFVDRAVFRRKVGAQSEPPHGPGGA